MLAYFHFLTRLNPFATHQGQQSTASGSVTSVHLTESDDDDAPRVITHVETSRAGNGDGDVTPVIHQALQDKDLLPTEHLTDTNSAQARQFVQFPDPLAGPTGAVPGGTGQCQRDPSR